MILSLLLLASTPVWIDTDPSVMPGGHEVDDGFAIAQAFRSPEISVRGVSVVFGNAPLEQAFPIGRDLVRRFGPKGMPVQRGAAGGAELGIETDASRAIAAALKREKLIILLLGPATNLGTVLKNHPQLATRIEKIVAVAGRRPDQHFTTGTKGGKPFRDFNFEMDAPAFQIILDSGVPLVLTPWEISSKVWIRAEDVAALSADEKFSTLRVAATDWLKMWADRFGVDGGNPFDTLAVGYVTVPSMLTCEQLPVKIEDGPDDTGMKQNKPYLLVSPGFKTTHSATYCHTAALAFKADLMHRLLPKTAHR
jgi:inosine-uridine nucleoside N-ribohydrolase